MSGRYKLLNHQKGQIYFAVVVLLVLIVVAWAIVSTLPRPQPLIKVHVFETKPSEFKSTESGDLVLKTENLVSDSPTTVTLHLETHNYVKIYKGQTLLPKVVGNFTYTKYLEPKETSELKFTVKGTLDVGDNSRDYYIKAYIYVNGELFGVRDTTFIIRRG